MMEKKVYIVVLDSGYGGKEIKRVFDREYDAQLFVDGSEAGYGSGLKVETWSIYQHGPQKSESTDHDQ